MNTIADKGIAAHWSYKENYNLVDNSSSDPVNVTWLRDLVEILDSGGSSEDLLEATKLEMFQDQVFCFTPKGDLIHLPANSNSIDFAYALHSEIEIVVLDVRLMENLDPYLQNFKMEMRLKY